MAATMQEIDRALALALGLLAAGDPELLAVVGLSLRVSLTAAATAFCVGIPLAAGVVTRFGVMWALGKERFEKRFMPVFGPLALLGLLYT